MSLIAGDRVSGMPEFLLSELLFIICSGFAGRYSVVILGVLFLLYFAVFEGYPCKLVRFISSV